MRISEIFYSIQGEGRLTGVPSLFIRTSGCNLRCVWCDTPYTSWRAEGKNWSIAKILREVEKHPARYLVITGGEPLLAPEIEILARQLKNRGSHITIETAATIYKPVACDLLSMSPKLANSTPWKRARGKFAAMHEKRRLNLPVVRRYLDGYDYQLKFVVERKEDFAEIGEIIDELAVVDPARVLIMPQGIKEQDLRRKATWIVELCKHYGYRFTPRLHIQLFGNRRAT
ncbi:MAG TPA: 7-carboxy-7-deazaguanine synthase QueE [Candidatus Limnocylindria bacterium]|nr:7-carboxy-7-deazaguanine synthase QueE [Candidatus Limnocylindria bacterium]